MKIVAKDGRLKLAFRFGRYLTVPSNHLSTYWRIVEIAFRLFDITALNNLEIELYVFLFVCPYLNLVFNYTYE